jgi:hypothetical protein
MTGKKGKSNKLLTGKELYVQAGMTNKRRIIYYAERVEASAILKRQLRQNYCIQRQELWRKDTHSIIKRYKQLLIECELANTK